MRVPFRVLTMPSFRERRRQRAMETPDPTRDPAVDEPTPIRRDVDPVDEPEGDDEPQADEGEDETGRSDTPDAP